VKILVVSSYPPRHCGIGAYASADVSRLREEGHRVVVLSPPDGAGDIKAVFLGGRAFLTAARLAPAFGRVIVHFQPRLYFRARAPVSKVATALSLLWLVLRRPSVEILVHEADPPRPRWRPDYVVLRLAFARARLLFHTAAERDALARGYRIRARGALVPHTDGVRIHGTVSRGAARTKLGIDVAERVWLCAGFLHAGKGFERAVRAFQRAGSPGRLFVVGSVRDPTPENLAYASELRALCLATPRVTFVEEYVPDEDFDNWIAAADTFVLPYRTAWSSGALARARKLGTPAIVSAVGGLAEQAGPDDAVFRSDEELADLLRPTMAR
jgi:glycosyltransferase involved in cell wall biosynthesis